MLYPHRIRLRGPWECVPLEVRGGGMLPVARRITMPGRFVDHGLASFAGRVRFERRFGYPGTIDEHERVWITCAGFDGMAEVVFNEHSLAKDLVGPFAFDVTSILKPHNRLGVTIEAELESGGLWGEVALEIRCTAYLRDVQARRRDHGGIEVAGVVAGTCERALELYVMIDGAQAHYQLIEARPDGTPFRFELPPRDPPNQLVRVDLVNVSTVWYAWEQPIPPLPFGERGRE